MIEPKFKKTDLENLAPEELKSLAETIFNESLPETETPNPLINNLLEKYENSVFINDDYTKTLLNNKINYASAINYIDDNCVINLKWLKSLSQNIDLKENRKNLYLKFPIEKVLLVEGITEEILLPAFSKFCGYDFYKEGIQIIPAGGKNQVVKMYYKLSQELKVPIYLLLDKDAEENIKQITPRLRNCDRIHLVSCGEFEDLLPKSLIIKTINKHLNNFASVSQEDFDENLTEVQNLETIFKQKGLHEFKKAEFAKMIRDNICDQSDISHEIKNIIEEISI